MLDAKARYERVIGDVAVSVKLTVAPATFPEDVNEDAQEYRINDVFKFIGSSIDQVIADAISEFGNNDSGASGAGFEETDAYEPEPEPEPSVPFSALRNAISRVPGYDKYEITGPALRSLQREAEAGGQGAAPADEDEDSPFTGCGPTCGCCD